MALRKYRKSFLNGLQLAVDKLKEKHMTIEIVNRRREAVMATRKKYGSRCMVP